MVIFSEAYVKEVRVFVLREKDVHVSYTTAKENVLDALNKIGLNSKKNWIT